jgi:hypothetical protein
MLILPDHLIRALRRLLFFRLLVMDTSSVRFGIEIPA